MRSGKLVLGLLAGVAVGAIAGILLAPGKGSKTRKRIVSKGEAFAREAQDKFDELVDSISKKYETARDEPGKPITKEKAKYDEARGEAKNATL